MPSCPRPARRRWSIPLSIALAAQLSACAPPIVVTPPALPCADLVEASGLLKPTPGAPLPTDSSSGAWIAHDDANAGQLDKANNDKAGVHGILTTCAAWQAKAAAAAKPRPWWRIWG